MKRLKHIAENNHEEYDFNTVENNIKDFLINYPNSSYVKTTINNDKTEFKITYKEYYFKFTIEYIGDSPDEYDWCIFGEDNVGIYSGEEIYNYNFVDDCLSDFFNKIEKISNNNINKFSDLEYQVERIIKKLNRFKKISYNIEKNESKKWITINIIGTKYPLKIDIFFEEEDKPYFILYDDSIETDFMENEFDNLIKLMKECINA